MDCSSCEQAHPYKAAGYRSGVMGARATVCGFEAHLKTARGGRAPFSSETFFHFKIPESLIYLKALWTTLV